MNKHPHAHHLSLWANAIAKLAHHFKHPQLMQASIALQHMAGTLGTQRKPTLGTQVKPTLGTQADNG